MIGPSSVTVMAPPAVGAVRRLTRLDVQGFKSFAAKTAIVFEPGITAIVGPNGSGKSNVADAVRWVLGEQGQAALRARRGEDVIFAGGQGRAPAGFAEATLTFDNAERWLPIDFAEVAVTRRVFRGGESQFLINGRRVRLKDIAQLTASLGQSHVVVGQGLVDAALSQKAEDRRALFEHAADLTGIRLKVGEAEWSLAETEANRERLIDLLSELEPRLRRLERAAKQADEWRSLRDRLNSLLHVHFQQRLAVGAAQAAVATAALETQDTTLAAARNEAALAANETDHARRTETAARADLAAQDAAIADEQMALRAAEHELALSTERVSALARRADDLGDTHQSLRDRAAAVVAARASLDAAVAALLAGVTETDAAVAARRQTWEGRRRELAALAQTRDEVTDCQRRAEQTIAEAERLQAVLAQRAETLAVSQSQHEAESATREQRLTALDVDIAEAAAALAAATAERDDISGRLDAIADRMEHATTALEAAATAQSDGERELTQARARHEALSKLQRSGAGLHAGVRAVLRGAAEGSLGGVRGAVAALIAAPAGLETALEVALGGHLQDIVVDRWADAEAAIALLKRAHAGRATFQPIETVRPARGPDARVAPVRAVPGVRGTAAELVEFAPDLQPVVDALLGRTLVVSELAVARAILPQLPLGWSAVTLAGEIARAGGSVTGGAAAPESGLLGRERELRELPAAIEALSQRQRERQTAHERVAAANAALVRERQGLLSRAATIAAALREEARQSERLRGWRDALGNDQAAGAARSVATEREAADIEVERVAVAARIAATAELLAANTADRAVLERQWRTAVAAAEAGRDDLTAAEHQQVTQGERLRGERRRQQELAAQAAALEAELAQRAQRLAMVERERRQSGTRCHELAQAVDARRAALDAHGVRREPLVAVVKRTEQARGRAERRAGALQAALLDHERAHNSVILAQARAADHLAAVQAQAAQELGSEVLDSLTASSPATDDFGDDQAAREAEISRVRDRLRRIGYVGDDVVVEFEREAEHHRFVRTQLDDVAGAAAALRALLAELHEAMRTRFEATFSQVATAFAANFTDLFGGGTAELVLTAGGEDDAAAADGGVDIVAQPPGKRLQNLPLLSGGERALTAVALLFAILRVNPAPFCLLDEVDAALDEANVVRFRDQLGQLAAQTQVIIVTHNRGTLEIANTLYGVSMGADGVSRTLSLRLDDAPPPA